MLSARFCIFIIITFLTSCTPILMGVIGIKNPRGITEEKIVRFSERNKIPLTNLFLIDNLYLAEYKKNNGIDSLPIKNHAQPLQIKIFNETQNIVGHRVNCQVGGFPNLKWNGYGYFDSLPPPERFKLDTIYTLQQDFFNYQFFKNKEYYNFEKVKINDYVFVVYYTNFMGRQSKRLIKFAQKLKANHSDKKIEILYVNMDSFFVD